MVQFTITTALAALATLATASPLPLTKSYRLYINVTNPTLDFPSNPVQGLYVATARAGATTNAITVTNLTSSAWLFSTTNHSTTVSTHTLRTDWTLGPYSIFMYDGPSTIGPHVYDLGVNGGNGTEGIYTSGEECTTLATQRAGTFAVCDTKFEVYTHPRG